MAIKDALLASPIPADPNDPEFDAVRADLGRLFIRRKLDLGLCGWSDAAVIANTNRIGCVDGVWHGRAGSRRHQIAGATQMVFRCRIRLFADEVAVPLDG
jgi:hypothetical protein